jgi:hypothetical protein
MSGGPNGGQGEAGDPASGAGGAGGVSGFAVGPPGAVFVPDQRFGNGKVTLTFTPG